MSAPATPKMCCRASLPHCCVRGPNPSTSSPSRPANASICRRCGTIPTARSSTKTPSSPAPFHCLHRRPPLSAPPPRLHPSCRHPVPAPTLPMYCPAPAVHPLHPAEARPPLPHRPVHPDPPAPEAHPVLPVLPARPVHRVHRDHPAGLPRPPAPPPPLRPPHPTAAATPPPCRAGPAAAAQPLRPLPAPAAAAPKC